MDNALLPQLRPSNNYSHSATIPRYKWLAHHLKFMDHLLRSTDLKSREKLETNQQHLCSLSEHYRASRRFLKALGDLVQKEDLSLFALIKEHRHTISLLSVDVNPSLGQPDRRKKGTRQEGPYKECWETPPVDNAYKPWTGAVGPTTRTTRSKARFQ